MEQFMNKMKWILVTAFAAAVAVVSLLEYGIARESANVRLKAKLRKPDITDLAFVGYNNWNYPMRNNGSYFYDSPDADHNGNRAGGEFPRGSGVTIVYAGGFYVGTIKNGHPVVSEVEFATEYQPGRISNSNVPFSDLTAEPPADAERQVYLIDRSRSGSDFTSWPSDAPHDVFGQPALIADAQTWAVFNDLDVSLNQDGLTVSPDPGLGVQVILESYVFNAGPLSDVVYCKFTITNKTNVDYAHSYLGMWMDADVDADNAGNDIVGVDTARGLGFVYNSDETDVHAATGFDFLQGPVVDASEVTSALATKFAGNTSILVYDPSANIYKPTTLASGKIWLGATAFNTYANGTDPTNNGERYNLLAGKEKDGTAKSGQGVHDYYAFRGNPITQQGSPDVASASNADDQRILHGVGEFTIKAGSSQEVWVGIVGALGTSRLNAVSNMFRTDDLAQVTFAAGLIAPAPPDVPRIHVAGLDGQVLITWENNSEYTKDIAGNILGIKTANGYTANYDSTDFEGYRVYRSMTGLPGSYQLLADYDLVDGFGHVVNYSLNTSGNLEIREVVVGNNTGLRHSYIDENLINGQRYYYSVTAYDAQPYIGNNTIQFTDPFTGVTIANPSGLPISLETAPTANVTSVVPQAPVLGDSSNGIVSNATHVSSAALSDGEVNVEVIDPNKLSSRADTLMFYTIPNTLNGAPLRGTAFLPANLFVYKVVSGGQSLRIDSRADNPDTYYDVNTNNKFDAGDIRLDESYFATSQGSSNDPSTQDPIIVGGLRITVFGPALQYKGFQVVANASGTLATPIGGAAGFQNFPLGFNSFAEAAGQQVSGAVWAIHTFESAAGDRGTFARFIDRTTNGAAAGLYGSLINSIVPFDFEIRFGQGSVAQYPNAFSGAGATKAGTVPFTLWRTGIGTPNDTTDDLQLCPVMLEDPNGNAPGSYDNQIFEITSEDHSMSGGDNDPQTDAVYWHLPPGATATSSGRAMYNTWATNLLANPALTNLGTLGDVPVIRRTVLVDYNAGSVSDPTFPANVPANKRLPEAGTIFRITTAKPNSVSDGFVFNETAPTRATSKSALKAGLKNILVVPNPYYGRSTYQLSLFDKRIKFTNLPGHCTIKVFTVNGDLVNTIVHDSQSNNDQVNTSPLNLSFQATGTETSTETWNLQNTGGKFVASGIYVALIEAPGIGRTTVKFAVIQEAVTINGPDVR